jgi:Uma2 family endonuclease
MAIVTPLLTPQDVLDMVNRGELRTDQPWELVDGEIVWLAASKSLESAVCAEIMLLVGPFAKSIGARLFDSSGGFAVGEHRQQLRSPDVSFVLKDRRHLINPDGWVAGAPDLAVEVLSQDEYGQAYARVKVPEYLSAGGKVVWLVHPKRRNVREYLAGRDEFKTYSEDSIITLDTIAPGFSARIGDFFPT